MNKFVFLLLIFCSFSTASADNVHARDLILPKLILHPDLLIQLPVTPSWNNGEANCTDQLMKSPSCDGIAMTEWVKRDEEIEKGVHRLYHQRQCLEENKCKVPLLIPEPLNNGIYCLTKVAKLMEDHVISCYRKKELGSVFEYKSPYGAFALKLMALRSDPLPANLRELAQSIPNVLGKKVKFDPQMKLASLVLEDHICPAAQRAAVLDCFKEGELVSDPGVLHVHNILSKRRYCAKKQDCLRQRGLDSPTCMDLSQKPAALVCECAKKVLGWLELEEHQHLWDRIAEKMNETCQPWNPKLMMGAPLNSDPEDQKNQTKETFKLDPEDLKKEVVGPLLEHFFCPETGVDFCENDEPVVSVPGLWPDKPTVEKLFLRTIPGISLDGMLPIG